MKIIPVTIRPWGNIPNLTETIWNHMEMEITQRNHLKLEVWWLNSSHKTHKRCWYTSTFMKTYLLAHGFCWVFLHSAISNILSITIAKLRFFVISNYIKPVIKWSFFMFFECMVSKLNISNFLVRNMLAEQVLGGALG